MPKNNPTSYELLKDTYAEIRALRAEMVQRFERIEERVDALEDFKSRMLGIAGILGAISSIAVNWIWEKITGK